MAAQVCRPLAPVYHCYVLQPAAEKAFNYPEEGGVMNCLEWCFCPCCAVGKLGVMTTTREVPVMGEHYKVQEMSRLTDDV